MNGSSSCVPYTVIQSSKGWVTSASHKASHQRVNRLGSRCRRDTSQASGADSAVR